MLSVEFKSLGKPEPSQGATPWQIPEHVQSAQGWGPPALPHAEASRKREPAQPSRGAETRSSWHLAGALEGSSHDLLLVGFHPDLQPLTLL